MYNTKNLDEKELVEAFKQFLKDYKKEKVERYRVEKENLLEAKLEQCSNRVDLIDFLKVQQAKTKQVVIVINQYY